MTKHSENENITQEQKEAIRLIFNSRLVSNKTSEELEKRIHELKEAKSSIRHSDLGRLTRLVLDDDVNKAILKEERELELNYLQSELSSNENERGD